MDHSGHNISTSFPGIIRPVLWSLGVVVIIFITYEIIERTWLQEVSSSTLHLLHMLRGFISSLIAAILVGWLIVKASPPLFSASITTDTLVQIERPTDQERISNFNRWFILMRWVAVIVAWMLTFLVIQVAEWLPHNVWWPLVITIGILAVLNLVYEYVFRKGLFQSYLLLFQAYADLIILVVLLHFSGGIENPLSLLMLFHVIIAGIVLNRKHCYAVAASASILLATVAALEATGILPHYTLTIFPHVAHEGELAHASLQSVYVISHVGLITGILFLTAYFVVTLADRIRHGERQLEKFADQTIEQRQLIEKALETTGTGLCVCNHKADPYWTNKRWESWFGKQNIDTYAKNNRLKDPIAVCICLKNGKTQIKEIILSSDEKDESRTIRITTAPLHDKEGNFDQVVSLAHDITEQKKIQTQMIRAGRLAAVGELAGHVAHEVNNPISIISAKCRLLISDYQEDFSPKVSQELEKIIGAADRVAHIAKGLLSYCRPSPAMHTIIDICAPLREAITMIGQRAKELNIEIDDRLPDTMPLIKANAGELQQVFLNIFLNAMDAMPFGGHLRITAHNMDNVTKDVSQWLTLSIQDTGIGIPDEIKDKIFEPFFTTKDEGKGTGLGLSICSGLIRSHGGTIEVESEQGCGTRFTICLPISTKSEEYT